MITKMSRLVLVALVTVFALSSAVPAEAATVGKRLNKLERQVKALQKKTRRLSRDGWDFFGFVHSTWIWNQDCTGDEDDARFYGIPDTTLFYLDCTAFAPTAMSVDAQAANTARKMEERSMMLQEMLLTRR